MFTLPVISCARLIDSGDLLNSKTMPPLLTRAAKSNVQKSADLVCSIKMLRHWCSIVGSSASVDGGLVAKQNHVVHSFASGTAEGVPNPTGQQKQRSFY